MKVKQLSMLMDCFDKYGFLRGGILELTEVEVKNIVRAIEKNDQNDNISVLLEFYLMWHKFPGWQLQFLDLDIDNLHARMTDKILNVCGVEKARNILNNFYVNSSFLKSFRNPGEYFTYFNRIEHISEFKNDVTHKLLESCLKDSDERRKKIISSTLDFVETVSEEENLTVIAHKMEPIKNQYVLYGFDLLKKRYDVSGSMQFVSDWQDHSKEIKAYACYNFAYQYMMRENEHLFTLPKLFLRVPFSSYVSLVEVLEKMDDEMKQSYLHCNLSLEQNTIVLHYLHECFSKYDWHSPEFREIIDFLLASGFIEKMFSEDCNIEEVYDNFDRLFQMVGSLMFQMEYNQEKCETLHSAINALYIYFDKCCRVHIVDPLDGDTYDNLKRLMFMSAERYAVFNQLMDLSTFREAVMNEEIAVTDLLSKENISSFDYLVEVYKDRELEKENGTYKSLDAPLTVFDALTLGYDAKQIFEGFTDTEEVTNKILVRSIDFIN